MTPQVIKDTLLIDQEYSPFKQLQTGYESTKKTRCSDRFVRYPYPKLFSAYSQHHTGNKLKDIKVVSHKKAFNLEKEAKIINPHRMEKQTHTK